MDFSPSRSEEKRMIQQIKTNDKLTKRFLSKCMTSPHFSHCAHQSDRDVTHSIIFFHFNIENYAINMLFIIVKSKLRVQHSPIRKRSADWSTCQCQEHAHQRRKVRLHQQMHAFFLTYISIGLTMASSHKFFVSHTF